MTWWAETERLALDHDGTLYLRDEERGLVRLGLVGDEPDVPPDVEAQLEELLDAWRDQLRVDERGEWEACYRRQSGVYQPV